jgi:hypothetical protein
MLAALSEDDFRDKVVRPLFIRKGFVHGAELCGPDEAGKDCFFRQSTPFIGDYIVVLQTKTGNMNMGKVASKNVEEAATQLRTAMASTVNDLKMKQKRLPNFGFFCSSGQINEQAKAHILDTVKNPNLSFLDVDDLIPEIDSHFHEYWQGVSADKFPYLKQLEQKLLTDDEFASLTSMIRSADCDSPVSDNGFVPLKLSRTFMKATNVRGQIKREPEIEEKNINDLLSHLTTTRVLIVGEAGSGKSTILKRAAEILCRQGLDGHKAAIPVLLKALNVSHNKESLAEQILTTTQSYTLTGEAAFSVSDIEDGRVCLLIDALDEVGERKTFDAFIAKLTAFDSQYPKCKVMVTGRNYTYITKEPHLAKYRNYNVCPIGLSGATKIVKNLGKKKRLNSVRVKEIMRQLESVHGFDLNPLIVTVFAASTDGTRKDIPGNITELFAKFTEYMLGRWDAEKGLSQQYEANLKALLLQKVAYKMHVAKTIRLPSTEFRGLIEKELIELGAKEAKGDVLIDEILNRSTLLRDVDGFTEFRHVLIQEYFAGREIPDANALSSYVTDEWWRRAIVFYFGSHPSDLAGLKALCRTDITHTPAELFNLGVALGLAAQACYFVKLAPKVELMKWSIQALATYSSTIINDDSHLKYPIHTFLFAYLVGRDAVAADCTLSIAETSEYISCKDDVIAELVEYWLIIGLLGSGHLQVAQDRIRKFMPSHNLPVLAIHMDAFFIEKIRGGSVAQKRIAKEISAFVRPSIKIEVSAYMKEFKSQLLEIQNGDVIELPSTDDAASVLEETAE